jgi:hypothetical protein
MKDNSAVTIRGMSDPFFTEAHGRFPLQYHYGSAEELKTRVPLNSPGPDVPRPDIPLDWKLYLLAFLCLDHFYIRSPWTGFFKLLTGGGLGIWWLWDIFQLFFEADRVKTYGMTMPGDFITGIGQGMITDKTEYSQRMPSIITTLAQVFGFMGFSHMSVGQMTAGLRILFIQSIAILCIYYVWRYKSFMAGFFSLFFGMGAIGIIFLWILNMIGYTEGDSVRSIIDALNYFSDYDFSGMLSDKHKEDLKIKSVDKKILNENLLIEHSSEKKTVGGPGEKKPFPLLALPLTIASMIRKLARMIWAMTPMGRAAAVASAVSAPMISIPQLAPLSPSPSPKSPPRSSSPPKSPRSSSPPRSPRSSQKGGSRDEMSVESQILSATVAAILGGGAMKILVESMVN